jgi:hypothetical protein
MNNNNDFEKMRKNINLGFKSVVALFILWFVLCATIVGGLIYVVVHFLAKVW